MDKALMYRSDDNEWVNDVLWEDEIQGYTSAVAREVFGRCTNCSHEVSTILNRNVRIEDTLCPYCLTKSLLPL